MVVWFKLKTVPVQSFKMKSHNLITFHSHLSRMYSYLLGPRMLLRCSGSAGRSGAAPPWGCRSGWACPAPPRNLSWICSVPIVSLLHTAGSCSCRNIAVALIDTSNNTSYLYCSPGVEHQRVIAPKGTKHRLENHGGDSRKHVTASVMFDAAGYVIPPRLVYAGVRNRFKQLAKIPTTGITGEWKHSVSENGYVNRGIFLEVLQDLDQSLTERNIKGCVHLGFHTSI